MLEKSPSELELADLEALWSESDQCDKRVFSEMRTNLQLVAGEQYVREGSKFWNRIRDNKQLNEEQRLKIVKNHIQRAMKTYVNSIQSACPGVAASPKDEKDMQHQKAAEQHSSVIAHWKTQGFQKKKEKWGRNFFTIGEVHAKVFWDANDGELMGYEAMTADPVAPEATDPALQDPGNLENGEWQPKLDESGEVMMDKGKPIYSGKLVFENVLGFQIRRDPEVGDMDESPYLGIAKSISNSVARSKLPKAQADQLKKGSGQEHIVFDTNTASYYNSKNQILFKEMYFRPTPQIPNGYFYHWTTAGIASKGELPYGIFPIISECCEEQDGNPRGISPIRHLRPLQVEMNRASSKVAEHQVTMGDDKLLVQSTSRLSQGALLPGIRPISYTGSAPQIMEGRSGEQFFPYLDMAKKEFYEIADLEELMQEQTPQVDIYTQLFRSIKFKRKFVVYSDRFERFLCEVVKTGLAITKKSAHPNAVIPMIGKSEIINMDEFKSSDDLCYQIKVEPRADDIEEQFGRQLQVNHAIQYGGQHLEKEDFGKLLRLSPFMNQEQMFESLTWKHDTATNIMLALDRGKMLPVRKQEDHAYMLRVLPVRMAKPDFEFLPPQCQQLYEMRLQQHEQFEAQRMAIIKQQESEFIPSGGPLIACDFYAPKPGDPNKTQRIRVPMEAMNWLVNQLASQGTALDQLEKMPGSALEGVAQHMGQVPPGAGPAQAAPQPGPGGQRQPPGSMNDGQGTGSGGGGLQSLLGQYLQRAG
jgi:hypothetical protein